MQPPVRPGVADVQGRNMFAQPFQGGQPAQGALPPQPGPPAPVAPPMPQGPGAGSTVMLPGESLEAYQARMSRLGFGAGEPEKPAGLDEASKKLMAQLTGGNRMGSQGVANPMLGGVGPREAQRQALPAGLPIQRRDQDIDDSQYGGGVLDMRAGAARPATPGAPPPLTPSQQAMRDNPMTAQMRDALRGPQNRDGEGE